MKEKFLPRLISSSIRGGFECTGLSGARHANESGAAKRQSNGNVNTAPAGVLFPSIVLLFAIATSLRRGGRGGSKVETRRPLTTKIGEVFPPATLRGLRMGRK